MHGFIGATTLLCLGARFADWDSLAKEILELPHLTCDEPVHSMLLEISEREKSSRVGAA